jgi:hypothetical protein
MDRDQGANGPSYSYILLSWLREAHNVCRFLSAGVDLEQPYLFTIVTGFICFLVPVPSEGLLVAGPLVAIRSFHSLLLDHSRHD